MIMYTKIQFSLSLKVNSRFCLKLEFSLGMKFYLSRT